MSNLLVQNIKHTNNTTAMTVDSAGKVTTTAVLNNDSTYESNGGAVTQSLVNGLTKAWVHYTQDGNDGGNSNVILDDSFNMSSITDNAVGRTNHNLTNNMANATYPTPFNAWDMSTYMTLSEGFNKSTSTWRNARSGGDFSTAVDATQVGNSAIGDLA